jgi:acyl-CoA synthetase (AMP-forming)/AMP-acid ligase II
VIATTVGRPAPDVELEIRADAGEVGEIVCRSPAMMKEYWRDPETTAATIDADGWLHTGDLGYVGTDGNLRIVGRLKEMYIRGGYNVYPAEVEATLTEHPAIAQAAVVGTPDPVLGERGTAFVVVEPGSGAPTLAELVEWCRARIADYKAPDRLVVVDAFPVNATHKVDKAALAAGVAGET